MTLDVFMYKYVRNYKHTVWLLIVFLANPSLATQFSVNSEFDINDANLNDGLCLTHLATCTLRAAISQSNHTVQSDTIILPAGHYSLSINGSNEDTNQSGDLDILHPLKIIGAERQKVVIDGMFQDRVLDIRATGDVSIENLSLIKGVDAQFLSDNGSAIRNMPDAQLSINKVDIKNNGIKSFHSTSAILQLGQLDAKHIRITENVGHAIFIDGPITKLSQCLISDHTRLVIKIWGIKKFATHELIEIQSCSIVNNEAGIMDVQSNIENIYISNTTVTNNVGSFLFLNDNFSTMHFINSTLYNNQIKPFSFSVNIDAHNLTAETTRYTNTLMTNNGSEMISQVDAGGFLSLGGNYFSTVNKLVTTLPSDLIDPSEQVQLSDLNIVDDFTQVFYPLPNSPLVDGGVDIGCTDFDQLGTNRPIDSNSNLIADCDVGAIEIGDIIFYSNFEQISSKLNPSTQ